MSKESNRIAKLIENSDYHFLMCGGEADYLVDSSISDKEFIETFATILDNYPDVLELVNKSIDFYNNVNSYRYHEPVISYDAATCKYKITRFMLDADGLQMVMNNFFDEIPEDIPKYIEVKPEGHNTIVAHVKSEWIRVQPEEEKTIEVLRNELDLLIKSEDYEAAAKKRDEIKNKTITKAANK